MLRSDKFRDVTRNDLFPTAEMVKAMSKEFGVPITADDLEGMVNHFMMSKEFAVPITDNECADLHVQ